MTTIATAVETDEDGHPCSAFEPGSPLPGGSRAWARLGVGHRCETWLAWSDLMWCPVVVKFPRPHQLDHPRATRTLRREAASLAGNLHPALPRLYRDGRDDAVPFLELEYLDGLPLDDALDEHGPLDPAGAAMVAVRLLSAARTVHARGLAHIDIKPANVMLCDGRAVLIDFGSARSIGRPHPPGRPIGSPGYAAPELEAAEPIDPAMDVFGIGVTLHEALTGEPPFGFDLDAADRPAAAPLPPSAVASLVERMIAVDPAGRPGIEEALVSFTRLADPDGESIGPAWAR